MNTRSARAARRTPRWCLTPREARRAANPLARRQTPLRAGCVDPACRRCRRGRGRPVRATSRTLADPRACLVVAVDDRVLSRLEHDVEVAAVNRLLCPPAVDD